jgi:hypothetical protein
VNANAEVYVEPKYGTLEYKGVINQGDILETEINSYQSVFIVVTPTDYFAEISFKSTGILLNGNVTARVLVK